MQKLTIVAGIGRKDSTNKRNFTIMLHHRKILLLKKLMNNSPL
ncbi:hypothetical protein RV01_GL001520 [Enterococcus dispar]|nr:hypothetical protein RV01_GL001520 [Enterococcus dispar]